MAQTTDDLTQQHAEDWLTEHGQPTEAELQRLGSSLDPADVERLHEMADQYDIPYDDGSDPEEIAEEIRLRMSQSADDYSTDALN